jgi:hypothetical protein
MPEQTTASDVDTPESLSAEGGSGASHDFRAEATQLRQELAKVKGLNRQALPLVNLALALKQAPGGADIVARLERGEALTAKQEATVEKVADAKNVSVEDLQSMFLTLEQRLEAREAAKEDLKTMNARADKEMPGLTDVLKTSEGKRRLNVVIEMIRQEAISLPDDEPDPYWFAYKHVYGTLRSENPDIGKVKKVQKTEAERRGAIVKASPKGAGAPEEEEIPEDLAFARRPIRRTGIGGFGKSLGEIRKH